MSYGRAGEVDRRDALEKGDSKELSPPLFPFPFPLLFMEMIEREKGTSFFLFLYFGMNFCPTRSTLSFAACSYIVFFCGMIFGYFSFSALSILSYCWGGEREKGVDDSFF